MPRHGQNPTRWTSRVHRPERITVAVLAFVPRLEGYWADGLEVLEQCLDSARRSAATPFDLLVFDNGCCAPVRRMLAERLEHGEIEMLFGSRHNLGKAGAWNLIFGAAPGEVVVYSDGDVLFRPGWLEASLEVLEAFPEAGMITAQPARRGLPRHASSTLDGAAADPRVTVQRGDLLSERFLAATAHGLGRTTDEYRELVAGQEDVLLERGGVRAYASADHFQFLTTRRALDAVGPLPVSGPLVPDDDQTFDRRIDEAGFWRLSTTGYLVHHLGNRPDDPAKLDRMVADAGEPGCEASDDAQIGDARTGDARTDDATGADARAGEMPGSDAQAGGWRERLRHSPFLRRLAKRLHAASYRWLYPS